MAEENTTANEELTPKQAGINLLKSIRWPLIWFGAGFVSAILWQNRKKRLPAA